ncbi:MAG TPA: toll/interleukin-1 receptor domain-containing protein, partial [Nodosilinea sp.]|nr:toll/interleukin-1 receptor domain-containing protein [Nodosilinea sp.]
MPSIFISYRRSDSHADAGRIYDRLAAHFGKGSVFKDVDDIPPGVDFRDYLNRTLNQCSVVLAVIGPTWLTATDDQGHRRLKNPADWVRVEIEEALEREGVLVIPLLVSHAAMPRPDDLPNSLQNLAFRNYREARPDPDFHKDMDRLIEGLSRYFRQAKLSPASTEFLLHRPNHFRHRLPSNQTAITRQKFLRWAGMGGASLLSLAGISQVWRRVVSPGSSDTSGWGTPSQTNDASGWGASPQTDTAGGWGATTTTNDETVPWAGDFGP